MMISISVVIPTYDRYDYLVRTISDLLNQTHRPEQIIIVDNTPRSERRNRDYFDQFDYPGLIFISSSAEGRVNVARNEGLARATEDIVLFFDDDLSLPTDCLEKIMSAHRHGWDAVTGSIIEDAKKLTTTKLSGNRPLWDILRTQHNDFAGHTIGVPSGFVSLRRSVLQQIGGFDEAYVYNYDDYDLGLRLWRGGCITFRDTSNVVVHHKAPTGGGRRMNDWEKLLQKYQSKYYFLEKHFSRRAVWGEFILDLIFTFVDFKWRPVRLFKTIRAAVGGVLKRINNHPTS